MSKNHDTIKTQNQTPSPYMKKVKKLGRFLLLSSAFLAGLLQVNTARAQITWDTVLDITNDTDVANWGTLVYAYDWANVNQVVNGVPFTGTASATAGGGAVTTQIAAVATTAFTTTADPFAALSAAYRAILIGADYEVTAVPYSVNLNNLVIGHQYLVQFWICDPRGPEDYRTEILNSTGGNSNVLDYSTAIATVTMPLRWPV